MPYAKWNWIGLIAIMGLSLLMACRSRSASNEVDETAVPDYIPDQGLRADQTQEPAEVIHCGEAPAQWVTDFTIYQIPSLDEPPARMPFTDPVFGTCLVRVTDCQDDLSPDDPSAGLKNEYSRVQSFNADGTYLLARSIEARWYLYEAATLRPVAELPLVVEPRWHATDPSVLYHFDETRLMAFDLDTGQNKTVHDFAGLVPGQELSMVWTRYEGSPSIDGNLWGLLAQDTDWRAVALLVYDLDLDRVVALRELNGDPQIDAVTISPLGNYYLAYHDETCEEGQLGDEAHPCGLMVYDRDLQHGRGLLPVIGHSDTALDSQGREVLVFQDIRRDEISILDLETGQAWPLLPIDFSHSRLGFHFSGRAVRAPGWVVVSTSSGAQPPATWMDDQVFVLELKPGGRVVRLAHTHSVVDETQEHDYWAEPHASPNPDLTRILFTSNWGRSGTGEVEMFVLTLPWEAFHE